MPIWWEHANHEQLLMAFRDCLDEAVAQGAISKEEASELQRRFETEFAQARLSLGDDAGAAAAKAKLETDLRAEGIEAKRRFLLQDAAQDRLAEYIASHRNLKDKPDVFDAVLNLIENHGFAGTQSLAGRQKAIVSLVHGELSDVLGAFRRSVLTGRRFNKPQLADVVREALGSATGKPEPKAMADALGNVFETLRQRFNAAGGAIGKIEGGWLPQYHDPKALLNAGRDAWKNFIRPLLDLDRMKDPLTNEKLTPARLEQSLDASFDKITTDGWSNRTPNDTPQGRGVLAAQRAEERFLHFKDADGWLNYNEQFGKGDPLKAIFEHINGMSRDIAAMEQFGPNPNATMNWLKQIVQTEAAKAITGEPSLYNKGSKAAEGIRDKLDYIPYRIDGVYQYVRGRAVVSGNMATTFGTVRNLLSSALLGSASITAAATDPFIDAMTRYLTGLPITKAMWGIARTFSEQTREQAVRSGIIMDDFLHILGDQARYAGQLGGSEWSKWLAERTMALSGLEPITQARKHVFALDFQAALGDHVGKTFDDLPSYLKRSLEGYGIDRTAWDVMRSTELHTPDVGSAGLLRPIDVASLAEGPALPKMQKLLGIDTADEALAKQQTAAGVRAIAEHYLEAILQQTERAVPTSTARSRSFFVGTQPRGSFWGEVVESGLLFKSFSLSFSTLQWQAIQQELHQGAARGAGYAGAVGLSLTLGGALALQLKNVINGKDPQPMNDGRFWISALQTGGGLGLLGDYLFSDVNRQNQSVAQQVAGPTVGLAGDLWKLTAGNLQQLVQGKKTNFGREAVNTAGRYGPVLSSLWYLRAAYRRVVLDQLQYLVDPEAHKNFREQEQRLRSETKQGFWWAPGHVAPDRAPALPQ